MVCLINLATRSTSSLIRQQRSLQQQPMAQQSQMQHNQNFEWFSDNRESVPSAAQTIAYVLHDFDAKHPVSEELSVSANEVVTVITDTGNGWLLVNRGTDLGYIPTTYVQFT